MAAKDGIRVHVYGDYDDRDIKKAIRGLESLSNDATKSQSAFAGFSKSMLGVGAAIGVGFAAFNTLSSAFGDVIAEAQEAIKVNAATAQIIEATGGAAKVTAEQVADLSQSLSEQIAVDDELIQSSANLILTFKNVANQGEGLAAIFDRTVLAAQDLSAAGFGDAESAAKMLGKALNDPERGLTALSRAGVTFTQQQKDQIQTLTEGGDVLRAQQLILAEVESQVGGVAAATATGIDQFNVYFDNLKEELGLAVLPLINAFISRLIPAIKAVGDGIKNTSTFIEENKNALILATVAVTAFSAALVVQRAGLTASSVAFAVNVAASKLLVGAINLSTTAIVAMSAAMRLIPFVAIATALAGFIILMKQAGDAQRANTIETNDNAKATKQLRNEHGILLNEQGNITFGAARMSRELRTNTVLLSATATAAVAAGNAMGKTLTPNTYEAGDAAEDAAKSYFSLYQSIFTARQAASDLANTSGTVSSAIGQGFTKRFLDGVGALASQYGAVDNAARGAAGSAGSATAATAKFLKLNEVLPDLVATAAEFGVNFAPSLRIANSEQLIERLKGSVGGLMERLTKAKTDAADFGNSIADTFRGFLSIADASDAFQTRQKAAVDALVALNAYRATMTAESTDDQKAKLQELADAHNRADTAARTGAQSIVAEFMAQAEEFGKFGEKMRRLLAAGLNKTTFTQIISMGAERGGDVADAYLNGNTAELVAQTNNTVKAYDDLATTIGDQSAQTFYAAGISAAVAILQAFSKAMGKDGSTRKGLKAIIADLQDDMQINVKVNVPNVPSFQSGPAAPSAPLSSQAGFVPFVDQNFGTGDPFAGGIAGLEGYAHLAGMGFGAFANGGLVKGPMLGLVGEAGPELIVPLDRLNGARKGSVINVTVNAGMGTDGSAVGEQIVSALRAYERRNGALPITVAS